MTFSIAARCLDSGMFGVALCSSSPAVAARCAHVRAGVGAALSQNVTDPALGPLMLDRIAAGLSAEDALHAVAASAPFAEYRQLLAIAGRGRPAFFSGARALGTHATATGEHCVAGGNMLASPTLPAAMVAEYESASGPLGDRLLAALAAAIAAGGEEGPVHSAGLKLVDTMSWPVADLRVDWTEGDPVAELGKVWSVYAPQMADYVGRARNPAAAPSYGVPGDL